MGQNFQSPYNQGAADYKALADSLKTAYGEYYKTRNLDMQRRIKDLSIFSSRVSLVPGSSNPVAANTAMALLTAIEADKGNSYVESLTQTNAQQDTP